MKIAAINIVPNGSTGKIMLQIANTVNRHGHVTKTYTPIRYVKGKKEKTQNIANHFYWGSRFESFFHYYAGSLFGKNGMYSKKGTRQLIKDLKLFNPDIIHLHNIHAYCINLSMLFSYIKKSNTKVIWTLHDCWSFTGHCPHFTIAKCEKWKTGCHHCPQPEVYPKMYLDASKKMYRLKKKWFTGIEDMTLVTPSKWLGGLVKQSFMNDYPLRVINNGIDLSVFKPTESDFRKKYNIPEEKKILLGVSFGWGYRKGLDVFTTLSERLNREKYQIVLVGTNDRVDQKLPDNIISIHQTNNQKELAEIYTAADLFINPTREDTYPTVNMEALACGTPILTFNTGGSPEIIDDTCGSVVETDDINTMEKEIIRICNDTPYSKEACLKRATEFDMYDRFKEYVKLYEEVNNK
jgi:glycosyltransferase involved in cell wall biosynthesis